ncbi:hypothetical protein CXG81DRAFT_8005, partial [Caulochytrium protostelioides]
VARTYASETPAAAGGQSSLRVTFSLPHATLLDRVAVRQVNLTSTDGSMGILAGHVPSLAQLVPGVVEVVPEAAGAPADRYFVSGGFAVIHPDSTLAISAIEAVPLADLDPAAIRAALDAATATANGAAGASEAQKVEARIQLEVFTAAQEA